MSGSDSADTFGRPRRLRRDWPRRRARRHRETSALSCWLPTQAARGGRGWGRARRPRTLDWIRVAVKGGSAPFAGRFATLFGPAGDGRGALAAGFVATLARLNSGAIAMTAGSAAGRSRAPRNIDASSRAFRCRGFWRGVQVAGPQAVCARCRMTADGQRICRIA